LRAVLGVHELSPGWASFVVKPKLGPLASADGLVPTIRGFISVNATPGAVDVGVPCNSAALLCLPRAASDGGVLDPATYALLLDGKEVLGAELKGGHLCLPSAVSCGAAGAVRQLRVRMHAPAPGQLPVSAAPVT
jgi:hypothetical protein